VCIKLDCESRNVSLKVNPIPNLTQAARQYFKKFEMILKKMGFEQCASDPCLFMRKNELGLVIILCYVDDNLCTGNRKALEQMLKEVVQHGLNITVEHELMDYLSCEIRFNQE
jgi:hypothetical protein